VIDSRDPWAEFNAPIYAVRGLAEPVTVSLDGRPGTASWDDFETKIPNERDRANVFEAFAQGAATVRLLPCR
jgi:hypothetical protein